MPSCKYCNEPMARKNDHLKVSFYMCPKCGARGPSVRMDHIGWKEELDARTLGLVIDADTASAEDDLRRRNAVLSARYSRLKSCELPNNSGLQRDVNRRIVALQNERGKMDKVKYLKELSHLYKQKAMFLEYKTGFESELSIVKHQIRENKKKLARMAGRDPDSPRPRPLGRPVGGKLRRGRKWCRHCAADCMLRGVDKVVVCSEYKEEK